MLKGRILLANPKLGRGKPSETRLAGLGLRPLVEPGNKAVDIDGSGGGDVLERGFGQAAIATMPQAKRPYALRKRAFNPRPALIRLLTRCRGLALACGLERGILGLGAKADNAAWRSRTAGACRTSLAMLAPEIDENKGRTSVIYP